MCLLVLVCCLVNGSDRYVEIPPGNDFWPNETHEPLMLAVSFPFIRHPPWQLKNTPKVLRMVRQLRSLFKNQDLASGDLLWQFLLFSRKLFSMPHDVV